MPARSAIRSKARCRWSNRCTRRYGPPTRSTTTGSDHIAPSASLHRSQGPGRRSRSARAMLAAGTCSVDSSTITTTSRDRIRVSDPHGLPSRQRSPNKSCWTLRYPGGKYGLTRELQQAYGRAPPHRHRDRAGRRSRGAPMRPRSIQRAQFRWLLPILLVTLLGGTFPASAFGASPKASPQPAASEPRNRGPRRSRIRDI